MIAGLTYKGDSFIELLKTDCPDALPDWSGVDFTGAELPHGTTVLSLAYHGGVLMAGDRLATMGHEVADRDMEKVFRIDKLSMMAIAGAAGPAVEMMRVFRLELEHFEKLDGEPLSYEGKANRLSFLLRQNMMAAMQGLVVMPLFAGWDPKLDRGRIYKFDITGGRTQEHDFYATGSGGKDARSSMKKRWTKEISRDDGVAAAVEALMDAADEDRATGGIDVRRGIYPIIKLATHDGITDVGEEEIHRVYDTLVERRKAA